MIDGYTLDYEYATWSGDEIDRFTDMDDIRHGGKVYVLRQYGEIVKVINDFLMDAYNLLSVEGILIHSAVPLGHPSDRLSPERFGWRAWCAYADSLTPTQPERLFA